jgi:PBP1b-binding outer membrane lipoprotein LpoB
LGVGREANNIKKKKKSALLRNLIEAKTGLIFWSDTGEGKD